MAVYLKNAAVIDGIHASPRQGVMVVTDGEKIVFVGDERAYRAPASEDRVIDLQGKTLMPGLIDVHEHIVHGKMHGLSREMVKKHVVSLSLHAAQRCRECLDFGITTIRDMGTVKYLNIGIRDAVANGETPGPRILTCGHPINATGGHFTAMGIVANGPDGVRAAAREVLAAGADFVKAMASVDPVTMPGFEQTRPEFTGAELAALFDEAHAQGKKATCHCLGSRAIGYALDAQADTIEHGCYMTQAQARTAAARGVFVTPTLSGYTKQTMNPINNRGEKWAKANEPLVQPFIDTFRLMLDAGVRMLVGTDTTGIYTEEVQLFRQYGMPAMDSLLCCTRNAAEALGLGAQLGTLESGKLADIIALDKDPLVDAENLTTASFVMHNGSIWKE